MFFVDEFMFINLIRGFSLGAVFSEIMQYDLYKLFYIPYYNIDVEGALKLLFTYVKECFLKEVPCLSIIVKLHSKDILSCTI